MPKLELRGRSFFYAEMGSHGDPLVFLSGLGGDHRAFNRPQRYFAAKYRAMAFDFRDTGQSDRSEPGYTTADMAQDVAAGSWPPVPRPAHIVGQSMGGLVAQEWPSAPALVKSLVLASTHAGADPWRKAVISGWTIRRRPRRR